MDIDAPELGTVKCGGRQNQAVRNDDQSVEFQAAQRMQRFLRLKAGRLKHAKAVLGRERLDGTLVQGLPATGRTVRLREYGADLMCLSQCIECWNGELRCAGETQP